jgi:hypothetical protein
MPLHTLITEWHSEMGQAIAIKKVAQPTPGSKRPKRSRLRGEHML